MVDYVRAETADQARVLADLVAPSLAQDDPRQVADVMARMDPRTAAHLLVVDRQGRRLPVSGRASAGAALDDPGIRAALAGQPLVWTDTADGVPPGAVVATVPVTSPDGRLVGALRASSTLEQLRTATFRLGATMALAAVVAAALAAIVGLLLAAPIASAARHVAQASRDLAMRRPMQPLAVPRGGPDEVAALVVAFNGLANQIRSQEDMRREFASDVSHELRSLASAMQTATEALQRGAGDTSSMLSQRLVAGLSGGTRRLARLADDLLDLARLDGGHLSVDLMESDLGDLVRRLVDEWTPEAARHRMSVQARVPLGPLPIRADPIRLAQALGNLVDNGLKYAGAGGWVRVEVAPLSAGSAYEVVVRDSGPGVPAELVPHVFERYVRARPPGPDPGGMGLGLAIARGIALAHGGDLIAEDGHGGRFVVRLPRTAAS